MLLRRVIDHVKNQNWTAVALDFVIVVLGVFIGIQVSAWNDALDDRNTEKAYLELLRRDLQSTMADVEEQVEFEQFQSDLSNSAYRLIKEPASEIRRQKLGMILTRLGARRTMKIDSPTFLDLQSSGKLGLISDPALRNDIVAYFFRIRRWEAVIEKNNEFFVDRSYNDYIDVLGVGYWEWDVDVMGKSLPDEDYRIGLMQLRIDEELRKPADVMLLSPPDSDIWRDATARLSSRASISVTNEHFASRLMDATKEIEQKIAAYLNEE